MINTTKSLTFCGIQMENKKYRIINIKKKSTILLALNKPKGYIVTRSDEHGRKTVYDLLPDWAFNEGWMPIGRLDLESKGLLLFTQNGKIGDALTQPG
jgi:23S rRNA pseudouridine2605 synthase